jgi:AcrR family transcriptional regulator
MTEDFAARRVPRQERGERRVAAILAAAATLLDEVGYDAMTVSAVAARAGAPIGSIYQFFPNKESIAQALAARYLTELRDQLTTTITIEGAHLPLATLLDHLLDPYMAFIISRTGYRAFLTSAKALKQIPASAALEDELVGRLVALFTARNDQLAPLAARQYAGVTMQIVAALAPACIAPDGTLDQPMIAELKAVLRGYLGLRLDGAAG